MKGTVHILAYMSPLCRFHPGPPSKWPAGHRWVSFLDEGALSTSSCVNCKRVHSMSDEDKQELAARQDAEAHMKRDEEEDLQQQVSRLKKKIDRLESGMKAIALDFELNEEAVMAIEHLLGERTPSGAGFFLSRVRAERIRQEKKWGNQDHPDANSILLDRDEGGRIDEVARNFRDLRAKELEICTATRAKYLCETAFERGEGSWSVLLVEEVAEAIEAIGDDEDLFEELVQVAAVAAAWGEAIQGRTMKGEKEC